MNENEPVSEHYRIAALRWCEADEAASLLEETKSVTLAQMMKKFMASSPRLAVNRVEMEVKASSEWEEFVRTMVRLRGSANRLKVDMDVLRMRAMEQQSSEATVRAQMRL